MSDGSNVAMRKNMADTVAASFKEGPSKPEIIAAVTLASDGVLPLLLTCCIEALNIASRMRPSALCLPRVRAASMRDRSGSEVVDILGYSERLTVAQVSASLKSIMT